MCEYCNDTIYDSRQDGFNYSPLYHLRQPFISNAAGYLYLATIDVPEGNPESEYLVRVAEKVNEIGGIGRWGVFIATYDIDGWSPVDYCPMCGRQL